MLRSLSLRNARRQVDKYYIYWGSLAGSVALIYSFNTLVFSDVMNELLSVMGSNRTDIITALIIFSVIVIMVLAWFVSYMTDFMLKKRSQEISTYMILGVERKEIISMLIRENAVIGGLALIAGMVIGLLLSEVLEAIVLHLFQYSYSLSLFFSLRAAGMSVLYFLVIYPYAQHKCKKRIVRMKLVDLLNYNRKNETSNNQRLAVGIFFLSMSVICGFVSCLLLSVKNTGIGNLVLAFLLVIFFLTLLFMGVPIVLRNIIDRSEKWKFKKLHLFLYRILYSKANSMSISLGLIAVLFTISIASIGMSQAFYSVMQKATELNEVFDVSILHKGENYDDTKYQQYLSESASINSIHTYNIYTNYSKIFCEIRNRKLLKSLNELDKKLDPKDIIYSENKYDQFMKYSDYCKIRMMLGLRNVPMDDDDYIIHCMPYLKEAFASQTIYYKVNNNRLVCREINTEPFSQYNGYGNGQDYIIVVPDNIVSDFNISYRLFVAKTNNVLDNEYLEKFQNNFDTLRNLSSNTVISDEEGFSSKLCYEGVDYISGKHQTMPASQAILLIIPLFYLALLACIMGAVIIAIQLLSENVTVIKQYEMLHILGMENRNILKTLRKHILIYYFLPFFPAVLCAGVLTAVWSEKMLKASFNVPVFAHIQVPVSYAVASGIIIFAAIYSIYVIIAYFAMKKDIMDFI